MRGCVAAVTATVSPSQPRPAVIHWTVISGIGSASPLSNPFVRGSIDLSARLSNVAPRRILTNSADLFYAGTDV
jgi:hypothetical protein